MPDLFLGDESKKRKKARIAVRVLASQTFLAIAANLAAVGILELVAWLFSL